MIPHSPESEYNSSSWDAKSDTRNEERPLSFAPKVKLRY